MPRITPPLVKTSGLRSFEPPQLSDEEMKITEPLIEKIQQLRATPKKELSDIQLIRMFIERRVQPLAARAHCMWDYTDRRDPT
jgi:hypothetical protein